jgi:rRNA maturation endonuclease Nob1
VAILLLYGTLGLLAVALAMVLYGRAVESRRTQRCSACGTPVSTELMTASSCSTCGSPLP